VLDPPDPRAVPEHPALHSRAAEVHRPGAEHRELDPALGRQPRRARPGAARVRLPPTAPPRPGRARRGGGCQAKVGIRKLTVEFGPVTAVNDLDLEVADGELVAIVGPSGCGKSTTLGFVAGFTKARRGSLLFDEVDVTEVSPQRRKIGFVFQDYAIYPHLSA